MLNDVRKVRLFRGLQKRLGDHRGSLAAIADQLATERSVLDSSYQAASKELAERHEMEHYRAIHDWDARREEIYLQSDRTTLAALRAEAKRLQELKDAHQRARQEEVASFQKAKLSLENQYEELKPKPSKQLERYQSLLNARRSEADSLLDQYRSVMLDRSVQMPTLQASDIESAEELPDSTQRSLEELQSIVTSMTKTVEMIRRDPMVRLSGSVVPWLIGVVPGLVLGFILWQWMSDQPYLAIGLTLATLVIVPIVLVFSLIPKVKRRMIGPYRELVRMSERIKDVSKNAQKMAETFCRQEQSRLLQEFSERKKRREDEHRVNLERLDEKLNAEQRALKNQQSEIRRKAAIECDRYIELTDQQCSPRVEQIVSIQKVAENEHQLRHTSEQQDLERKQSELYRKLDTRVRTGTERAESWLAKQKQLFAAKFPTWQDDIWTRGDWPRSKDSTIFPIGTCAISIPPSFENSMVIDFDLLSRGSLIIEADFEHRQQANGVVQSLLARAFSSLPMGDFQCVVIDPEGLGKDFGWLMQLADADPRLVGHRIWTQHAQIAEQLSMLAHQNEEIIQQRLRDRYANILEYNADAGPMAEPLRLVVWSNFPFGLDESSWKSLCALLASGARCGIGVVLTIDPNHPWPVFADRSKILQAGLHLRLGETARVVLPELEHCELRLDPPPSPSTLTAVINHCTHLAMQAGKIEVPFNTIGVDEKDVGVAMTNDSLIVPLGVAGVGRTTSLRLGHGTAQHVLVAGKTGSGKSSLLHTLITSAALKYPPDQLRMVLLDFKKGVEFQIYAQQQLPHADIIGIESRREFGLSALEYLDRVMHVRGELFRQANVQDIPSWSRSRPDQKMPRVLVVIDEFQEMFVEDDKLAQQSAMLLDRVVRQGRSFGIHMVLASQTLGGSYSLPRTTLAQMAVRIALQCDGADAMMILGEDNLAATRLRHSGQAIYNDAGGRVESNQPFQVAYLTSKSHVEQLSRLPRSVHSNDPSTNMLGRQIIFEGHKPAVWNTDDIERGVKAIPKIESSSIPMVLGESLSIEPTIIRSLTRQAGRNCAIVGSDDGLAANLIGSMIRGWLHMQPNVPCPMIYFLDGTRAEDERSASLRPWLTSSDFLDREQSGTATPKTGDTRSVEAMIAELHTELERRMSATDQVHSSVVLFVANLARFRELKHVEDFSFGSSGDKELVKPDAAFLKLLREGPSVGMHTVCWADSWGTLSRFVPRQALRDMEVRILMQMSSNDSNQLIDASTANKLEPHAMIYFDETDGKIVKFRPYRFA